MVRIHSSPLTFLLLQAFLGSQYHTHTKRGLFHLYAVDRYRDASIQGRSKMVRQILHILVVHSKFKKAKISVGGALRPQPPLPTFPLQGPECIRTLCSNFSFFIQNHSQPFTVCPFLCQHTSIFFISSNRSSFLRYHAQIGSNSNNFLLSPRPSAFYFQQVHEGHNFSASSGALYLIAKHHQKSTTPPQVLSFHSNVTMLLEIPATLYQCSSGLLTGQTNKGKIPSYDGAYPRPQFSLFVCFCHSQSPLMLTSLFPMHS